MNKFQSLFKLLDIVSPEVKFHFKNSRTFNSLFGSLMTIIMLIPIILITLFWSISVINYSNSQTSVSNTYENDTLINLTSINYPIAVFIVNSEGVPLENSSLYFHVYSYYMIIETDTVSYNPLELTGCTQNFIESTFGDMNSSFKSVVTTKYENSSYCLPALNPNIAIRNSYGSTNSRLIDIGFSVCKNSTMNNKCKSYDEIINSLENLVFYVVLTDLSIDNRKMSPTNKVVSNKPYLVSGTFSRRLYVNYHKVIYNDDKNLFYNNETTNNFYQIKSTNWELTTVNTYGNQNFIKSAFFEVILTMESQISDVYSRTFTKFPQILAQISSVFNLFYFSIHYMMEFFFVKLTHQDVFDNCFKEKFVKKLSEENNIEKVNNNMSIDETSMKIINRKNSDILGNPQNIIKFKGKIGNEQISNDVESKSFTEFWKEFKNNIIDIAEDNNREYFLNLFPCRRNANQKKKLIMSKYFYDKFFDANFIFINLIELILFKDNYQIGKYKK